MQSNQEIRENKVGRDRKKWANHMGRAGRLKDIIENRGKKIRENQKSVVFLGI